MLRGFCLCHMMFHSPLESLEESIRTISHSVMEQKNILDAAVQTYKDTPVSTVSRTDGLVQGYQYFLYPFKGMTLVNSAWYQTLGVFLSKMIPKETEVIVTIEADGIGIAHFVGAALSLPVIISKHFHYHVPHISFVQQAGYHKRDMYLPTIIKGKKVAIVDCMVSTGGTVQSMIEAIQTLEGTVITGIFCVNDKTNYRQKEKKLFGYPYKYLIDTRITPEGKVEASWSHDLKTVFWEMMDSAFYTLTEACSEFSTVSKRGYKVGSIIVDADRFDILAWGFRRGNVHAEQDAIAMLKQNCPDWASRTVTIYSTMEPCVYRNDEGQTPCAQHIAQLSQCRWVIIGSKDAADKKIFGEGINYLLSQGKNIRLIETGEVFRAPTA
jgi:adenine phosphoribosyltransferase